MSNLSMDIHDVKNIRVSSHNSNNSNSLRLQFVDHAGETFEICTFGLPDEIFKKLVWGLSDNGTKDHANKKVSTEYA